MSIGRTASVRTKKMTFRSETCSMPFLCHSSVITLTLLAVLGTSKALTRCVRYYISDKYGKDMNTYANSHRRRTDQPSPATTLFAGDRVASWTELHPLEEGLPGVFPPPCDEVGV